MKRYLKLSIIRKLPLFVVLSVLFLAAAFFSTAEVSFERSYYGYSFIQMLDTSCTSSLLTFFFITMMVLPLFNMNYRYSLARSDLYRQVGFKNNSIRIGEHLSTLITVCISFTFSFAVLVSILLFKNYTAKDPIGFLAYHWYIGLYFVALLVGVGQFFLSYLLVSRSNTFINSAIMLFLGQFFLNFFLFVCVSYIRCSVSDGTRFAEGPSIVGAIAWVSTLFNELICSDRISFFETSDLEELALNLSAFWSTVVIFFSVAALGAVAFILEKDPSSEWAGKPDTDKPYQEIIYHAGFATIGLVIGTLLIESSLSLVFALLFYPIYIVSYYTFYGLLHRNFKLKGRQAAVLFGIAGSTILFSIIYTTACFYAEIAHGM